MDKIVSKEANKLCSMIIFTSREKIFNNLEYDKKTSKIYEPCSLKEVGHVKNGKIYWTKNN